MKWMTLFVKELRLTAHPTYFIFPLLGCLVIVPSYPYTAILLFGCLAPFLTLMNARENNDLFFTSLLPVSKKAIVRSKCLIFAVAQLTQLALSVPFALLRWKLEIPNNPVGMDATAAWYGFALLIFAVFDGVFFPLYFKTGYKVGGSFLTAILPAVLGMAAVETMAHLPTLAWLDSCTQGDLLRQIPILIAGAVCYLLSLFLSCRIAERHFDRVDL